MENNRTADYARQQQELRALKREKAPHCKSRQDLERLVAAASAKMFGVYAREIMFAANPAAKLEELKPLLTHPEVDDGALPWIFSCFAMAGFQNQRPVGAQTQN